MSTQTTSMNAPMVSLDAVHLTIAHNEGAVPVLRGVDMRVDAGQSVSVVGPSGSGKTTLLMVIAGLEKPSSGTISVAGTALERLDEDALALFRRGTVGIVFQSFHLIPTMTALENVALPLEFASVANPRQRARDSLEMVGLSQHALRYPAQLSGGEQQRVAIARAFAPGPALLLADEPTGNLDAATGDSIADLLFTLCEKQNMTFILVTHAMDLAARCKQTMHMHDGILEHA